MNIVIGSFVSVFCWVLWAMTLLSLPADLNGGGFLIPDLPYRRSAFYGLIVGIVHLAVTATLIFLWEVDSIFGTLISSVLATEILIIFGMMIGLIRHFRGQRRNFKELRRSLGSTGKPAERLKFGPCIILWAQGVFVLGVWISILTAFFIIPSSIVGLASRLFV